MSVERMIIVALIGVLIFVAIDDIRNFRIKNGVIVMLFCLCVVDFLVQANLREFVAHCLFAAVAFALLLIAFQRGLIGGGDTKLLTLAFLGIGPDKVLAFAIFLFLFTLIYWCGAKLDVLPSQRIAGRLKVPFGPSIAGAWVATLVAPLMMQSA